MEGTPDFGNQEDWERWEDELAINELDIASAVLRHPASRGAREVELTEALLNDGWRQRHERMKDALKSMRNSNVFYLDDYRPYSPFDDTPPALM